MGLLEQIISLSTVKSLPEYSTLLGLLDRCVNILEKEDSSYRPYSKACKCSGGLLSFIEKDQKPVIVIPDLHARRDFFVKILTQKISLKSEGKAVEMSVFDALCHKLIYVVFVGDLFHSEVRGYARWKLALVEYTAGNILSPSMIEEMQENLNLLEMVLLLKINCPESFHFLKGNHENILNEEGRGNHPFYKMAAEGEMFYSFMSEKYDDALIYFFSLFEHSLPVCAIFANLVVSHAEPETSYTKTKIVNFMKYPEVVLGLTWTGNDQAQRGSVSKTIKNLVGTNCRNVTWIGGHRPVEGKYALRQRGKYVQIHNPFEENIAVVSPARKFNPKTDIYTVSGDIIEIE